MSDQISGNFITTGSPHPTPQSHILHTSHTRPGGCRTAQCLPHLLIFNNNSTGKKIAFYAKTSGHFTALCDVTLGGHPGGAEWGVLGENCSPNPHPPVPKSFQLGFQFHAGFSSLVVCQPAGPSQTQPSLWQRGNLKMMVLLHKPHGLGSGKLHKTTPETCTTHLACFI